jgi:hypothetical protein
LELSLDVGGAAGGSIAELASKKRNQAHFWTRKLRPTSFYLTKQKRFLASVIMAVATTHEVHVAQVFI